jgi:RimJ/RimL family protein N-acetyltransferase
MTRSLDVLITRNLTLRPPLEVDAEDIAEALADPAVSSNLSNAPHPYTLQDAYRWIEHSRTSDEAGLVYTAHKERLIGVVQVHLRDEVPTLGYWFRPEVWGRGFASQAAQAALAYAFRHFEAEAVASYAYQDNHASLRVLEKLGFSQTGESTRFNHVRGEDVAAVDVRLTREAFEERFGPLDAQAAA